MEAKTWRDTVMDENEICDILLGIPTSKTDVDITHRREAIQKVTQAQAKLAFKMGQEKRTPRTDLENELADKVYARLYRKARIKSQRELDICSEAYEKGYGDAVKHLHDPEVLAIAEGELKKAELRGVKELLKGLAMIDKEADDTKDFTSRVCDLLVEWEAKLKEGL